MKAATSLTCGRMGEAFGLVSACLSTAAVLCAATIVFWACSRQGIAQEFQEGKARVVVLKPRRATRPRNRSDRRLRRRGQRE